MRNTRVAGMTVYAPAQLAEPHQVGRCRRDARGSFRLGHALDEASLAQQLAADHARVQSAWAEDAYPVRVEVGCDPAQLILKFDVSWYAPSRSEVLHGEDPAHGVAVDPQRRRDPVTAVDVGRALAMHDGEWVDRIVVHGDGS